MATHIVPEQTPYTRQAMTAAAHLLPRGVHLADYLIDGWPVLQAITSDGNCLRRVKLTDEVDEGVAREWLDGLLEHYDNPERRRAHLRLVRPRLRPVGVVSTGVFLAVARGPHAPRRTRP